MPISFAPVEFNDQKLYSKQFQDIYFCGEPIKESQFVFLEGNQLFEKWQTFNGEFFTIAETGFGAGVNFCSALKLFDDFKKQNPNSTLKRLHFISFEKYPLAPEILQKVHQNLPFEQYLKILLPYYQPKILNCDRIHFENAILDLWWGDALQSLQNMGDHFNEIVDAWFLDGFAPSKNPEMWNDELFSQVFRLSKKGASLATFTVASKVREGLTKAGFSISKKTGFAQKREMLTGVKNFSSIQIQDPIFYQESASKIDEIAIAGGGVASFFIAYSLLKRGKKVTLYCADQKLGQNASSNQQAIVYPQLSDDDARNIEFYYQAFNYAKNCFDKLSTKFQFEKSWCGVALLGYDQKSHNRLEKISQLSQANDLINWCDDAELTKILGVTVANSGIFISKAGWINAYEFITNGFKFLQKLGLKIVLDHKIENFSFKNNKVYWGENFSADCVILANSFALKDCEFTKEIPIYPIAGQVSCVKKPIVQLKAVLCFDGYIAPVNSNNYQALGATHQRNISQIEFSALAEQQNLNNLQKNIAQNWTQAVQLDVNKARVDIRSNFRDRMPVVGQAPNFAKQIKQFYNVKLKLQRQQEITKAENFNNLFMLAGLGSRGFTTAPILGELLASLICKEPLIFGVDICKALHPARSWLRKMIKGHNFVQ